jgi:CRISPR/Cas system endoribonuclease Cas6 (RAMP superfamily)
MDDFFKDFNLKHESLAFYIDRHDEISLEFIEVISKDSNGELYGQEIEQWKKKLGLIIIKIIKELQSILEMLDHIDVYKREYEDIVNEESDYCDDFDELNEDFQDKIRKCMTLKFLEYYQDRYETLCKGICGERKNKVSIDEFLL